MRFLFFVLFVAGVLAASAVQGSHAAEQRRSAAEQVRTSPKFTTAQADAARQLYTARCAQCHGANFQGGAGPALSGALFSAGWTDGQRPLSQMFDAITQRMPPEAVGSLSEAEALSLMALILETNKYVATPEPLVRAALDIRLPRTAGNTGDTAPLKTRVVQPGAIAKAKAFMRRTLIRSPAPQGDWPQHNLNISNGRFSPLTEITSENVSDLALRWVFEMPAGTSAGANTPIVVDGTMYLNSGSQMLAIDAATGELRWKISVEPAFPASSRGPTYGDGRIYASGGSRLYAVDAKTGAPLASFGNNGSVDIVLKALQKLDPGKYADDFAPTSIGYGLTASPVYAAGTLYLATSGSMNSVPGGLVFAVDANTGALKWVFRTIPQGPNDEGWDLTKDTWSGPKHLGGGVWYPPAIDLEVGLLYVNVANPAPYFDGSSRKGANLFSNSVVALRLDTGKVAWHYQGIHHDIWDWDMVNGPTLIDVTLKGAKVKALASVGKHCFIYFLNRETGVPVYPIVEHAVHTYTDMPGEEPWPTQPIPYNARGVPMTPPCATYPRIDDPELAKRRRPMFTPWLVNAFITMAPGVQGGPSRGSSSFSPQTGLLYVTGKNWAFSMKVKPGDETALTPGPGHGAFGTMGEEGPIGDNPNLAVSAFDPKTGDLAWSTEVEGISNGGNLATAGNLVFQPSGQKLYAFNATNGKKIYEIDLSTFLASNPMTYQAGGQQFVVLAAGSVIVGLGLP